MSHWLRTRLFRHPRLRVESLEDRLTPSVSLVKDFNLGMNPGGSDPADLCQVGTKLYFSASDPTHGRELWVTDGTTVGTVRVADIHPGNYGSNPTYLTNVNGILFFRANDGNGGNELWRSNGTATGTFLVREIGPATRGCAPSQFLNDSGVLYFRANDSVHGYELWRSNGTSTGTFLVADLAEDELSSDPFSFVPHPAAAGFFFSANTPDEGRELWFSNGTSTGTVLVEDINPGTSSSFPQQITAGINGVYFAANDGTLGSELWYSQGSSANTILIKDIRPGAGGSFPTDFALSPTAVMYFRANDGASGSELWSSNSSSAGTFLVNDILPGLAGSFPTSLTFVGSTLYFAANGSAANGTELWKSNGSSSGTTLVEDIYAGATGSSPTSLINVGGTLFFVANTAAQGQELWKSDGTLGGTQLVLDINAGATSSNLDQFTNFNSNLYFTANDGANDFELWKSAGAATNTAIVRDLFSTSLSGSVNNQIEFNGQLYFAANSISGGTELWRSDGTPAGTQVLLEINPGAASAGVNNFAIVGSLLYFRADDGINGSELWRTDGTAAGTTLVANIAPGALGSAPRTLTNVLGTLYFVANDGTNGYALWKHTSTGTVLVKDMDPDTTADSYPTLLTNINGTLYFLANDGLSGRELWKSTGTATSTVMVRDIGPGSADGLPLSLTEYHGKLLFQANDGINGTELWISDGTFAGTTLLADINPGEESSIPGSFLELDNTIYFSANDGVHGRELWATDGTSTGTHIVRDIRPGIAESAPSLLVNLNGALAFRAFHDAYGRELWTSDGTSSGTKLVRDIEPGTDSSTPSSSAVINGMLYFRATTATTGGEIWRSDGTSAGTVLLDEVIPGSGDGFAFGFVEAGGVLYFEALDDTRGTELWRLDGGLPPTITSNGGGTTASFEIVENTLIATTVTATDPNTGALTYTIVGGFDAGDFNINSSTGLLTFVPRPNYETPADAFSDNTYQVIVRVSDGTFFDQQTITITVVDDAHDQSIVYVDAALASTTDGTNILDADPSIPGNQTATVGVNAFATLERAIDSVAPDGKVTMFAGTYIDPAVLNVPFTLQTPSGTVTISGSLTGTRGLRKSGFGSLVVSGSNGFTGGVYVGGGRITNNSDDAFGDALNIVEVGPGGTLQPGASFTTSRTYLLDGGTILLNPGFVLTFNNANVYGGHFYGTGVYRSTDAGASYFHGVDIAASTTLDLRGTDTIELVTNNGLITTAAGKSVSLLATVNNPAGRLTLNGPTSLGDFTNIGQMTVNAAVANNSLSPFIFGGGSLTTINATGSLNTGTAGALVTNGYVLNKGTFGNSLGTITVDFGGKVEGNAVFGSLVTRNGGVFSPGSSPGPASTHRLNINGGGTLEFEITNASGTPAALSGWDMITVGPTVFSASPFMDLTATQASKFTILLASRADSGDFNTPGTISNFNSALSYAWKFADGTAANQTGTFDAKAFAIDTSGFQNSFTGGFSVELRDAGKNLYVVYTPVAGPMVSNIVVNDGNAQRSRLTKIAVNFATPVDAATLQAVGAITLTRTAALPVGSVGTLVNSGNGLLIAPASGMVSSITLTFANTNTTGIDFGSLDDGRWQLAIPSAGFTSTLNDTTLRRLFGDENNDGTVNASDFAAFGNFFGATVSNNPYDFDNNGTINAADFAEFGNRFGLTL